MKTHPYTFTTQEVEILREALREYKHHIKPVAGTSVVCLQAYRTACALFEQFKQDMMR